MKEETKEKIRQTLLARNADYGWKISKAKKGKSRETPWMHYKKSEETKKKISDSKKGSIPWNKGIVIKNSQLSLLSQKEITKMIGYANKGNPSPYKGKLRPDISNALKGRFKGNKSSQWKGGISSNNELIRSSFEMKEWKRKVFKRDNWTCQMCGQNGNIIAHHILEFARHIQFRFDVWNGKSLCKICHTITHREMRQARRKFLQEEKKRCQMKY